MTFAIMQACLGGGPDATPEVPFGDAPERSLQIPRVEAPRIVVRAEGVVDVLYLGLGRTGELSPIVVQSQDHGTHFHLGATLATGCVSDAQWLGDYQSIVELPTRSLAIWNGNTGTGPLRILCATVKNR